MSFGRLKQGSGSVKGTLERSNVHTATERGKRERRGVNGLILPSFEVKGFRAFKNLRLESLGRANLIVGRNNVGKSCLLEALRLYFYRATPWVLHHLLVIREEVPERRPLLEGAQDVPEWTRAFENLFHGRRPFSADTEPIQLGPIDLPSLRMEIAFGWYVERRDESGVVRLEPARDFPSPEASGEPLRPALFVRGGGGWNFLLPLDVDFERMGWSWRRRDAEGGPSTPCLFVSSGGLSSTEVGRLWDRVALTEQERTVTEALRIIEPEVERVALIERDSRNRTVLVKLAGNERPIPLRSLGEGMNRMFGIVLALVNARGGVLLLDEVENGLHFTVLPAVWRLILKVSRGLGVQVFATTHSWDCIEAFQEAVREEPLDNTRLIRLETRDGEVHGVIFDEAELAIVTREKIEVR